MTSLSTCSKCGWKAYACYMGNPFDRQNRCPHCQPKKVLKLDKEMKHIDEVRDKSIDYSKVNKKKIDWEKERANDSID